MPPPPLSPLLLIQTAFIGDVILATALLEYLAHAAPGRPVDVLVRRGNEGLLTGHPHVRRVLVWDKKPHKYRSLRQVNPSPYLYFLRMGDTHILGSSPEMLVRVTGRKLEYRSYRTPRFSVNCFATVIRSFT